MSSGYSGGFSSGPTPAEKYQIDFSNATIQYPASNFLALEVDLPATKISELLNTEIKFFENKSGNRAEIDLFKSRSDFYKSQKAIIDSKVIDERQKLQRENQFLKEIKDFSSINFANIQADQARIEGNTKKFLSLGILGAALLG